MFNCLFSFSACLTVCLSCNEQSRRQIKKAPRSSREISLTFRFQTTCRQTSDPVGVAQILSGEWTDRRTHKQLVFTFRKCFANARKTIYAHRRFVSWRVYSAALSIRQLINGNTHSIFSSSSWISHFIISMQTLGKRRDGTVVFAKETVFVCQQWDYMRVMMFQRDT